MRGINHTGDIAARDDLSIARVQPNNRQTPNVDIAVLVHGEIGSAMRFNLHDFTVKAPSYGGAAICAIRVGDATCGTGWTTGLLPVETQLVGKPNGLDMSFELSNDGGGPGG